MRLLLSTGEAYGEAYADARRALILDEIEAAARFGTNVVMAVLGGLIGAACPSCVAWDASWRGYA